MPLLNEAELTRLNDTHPQWQVEGDSMTRTFEFPDFVHAMAFVTRVALVAEKASHHPDIDVRWNRVTLTLSTHSEGGLTEKDVALADELG